MLHFARKPFSIALAGISLIVAGLPSHADDLLSRATTQFRDKDYNESFLLAQKSAESPQRDFLLGVAALRLGRFEEAVPLLQGAEKKLPLIGDYAALYQAEALLKLKKYVEASAKAASIQKSYPASLLIRRSEKLYIDAFFESGDYRGALKASQSFIEKYPSGSDSVDALYNAARSREETDDKSGAALIYRSIWLNNPASSQAEKARERLSELEKLGIKTIAYTPEELLRRSSALYAQNCFAASLQTLQSIQTEGIPKALIDRIELRTGMTLYRLRNDKAAEKSLTNAATSLIAGIRSEARFWQAKALERQNLQDRAYAIYMEIAAEGSNQEFADDALMEAAGLLRVQGKYSEAARLFEQIAKTFPKSKFISRAAWDAAWSHYLAGENKIAAESFNAILRDDAVREKALYWLARSLEKTGSPEATAFYKRLLDEYPDGFYASWHREQKGIKDERQAFGNRSAVAELPLAAGFDKPRLLASLGMLEEARNELSALRKKKGDKKNSFPELSRIYLEMNDNRSAIDLFQQNRPLKWDSATLPLWSAGFPMAYAEAVTRYTTDNTLSQSLVYALIRAESAFSPAIKSPAGAIGLMQLMPKTAEQTAKEKGTFNPLRLTIPEYNIKLGTKHFSDLLKGYDGDVVYSVAAYNAGAGAVNRWRKKTKGLQKDEFIESIPYQETRDYVKKVYASAAIYRQLYGLK